MIIFVDIDETICITPEDRNYANAKPLQENIKKINELYDNGDTITYWTARGSGTGKDWYEVTRAQLIKWGAKHHKLRMWKPTYDLFICDKAVNSLDYFKEKQNETK